MQFANDPLTEKEDQRLRPEAWRCLESTLLSRQVEAESKGNVVNGEKDVKKDNK